MKGYVTKGKMKYKVKYLLVAQKEIQVEVEGNDLDIDDAEKIANEKATAIADRLGNGFKIKARLEIIGSKEK